MIPTMLNRFGKLSRQVSHKLPALSSFSALSPSTSTSTSTGTTQPIFKHQSHNYSISDAHETYEDLYLTSHHLQECDPTLYQILCHEEQRQRDSIVLIPSENYTSKSVLEALGSMVHNTNIPGSHTRDHITSHLAASCQNTDAIEKLCQQRALAAYNLDPSKWGVNVQPYSGSPVNFGVYTGVLQPRDRIMSLDLPHGGHLSHGYQTPTKKISAVSIYWEVLPYRLNEDTGRVDYDQMELNAGIYRPKMIVSGASAYSRHWDCERIRKVCDDINAIMLFDMAHISGLVAGGVHPSPFDYADIVTTTTHKSLRGPRAAMVFYRKGVKSVDKKGKETLYDFEDKINNAIYPGIQDGPCNHTIAALCTALQQAATPEFREYQERVILNSKSMVNRLIQLGYDVVSDGTDNHLALINLRPKKVGGAQVERVCELANIALNKNTVPGDKSALTPGGVRIGSPAMTTRGLNESDFSMIAEFIDEAVQIAFNIQKETSSKKFKDFQKSIDSGLGKEEIEDLKNRVKQFSHKFPLTGIDEC